MLPGNKGANLNTIPTCACYHHMRKFLQRLLTKPVIRLADKLSSRPDEQRVKAALTDLYTDISSGSSKKGPVLQLDAQKGSFIVFSDLHKGARDGMDIFARAENNYLAALEYYNQQGFHYICLGDSEELWENLFPTVKRHNTRTFQHEKLFINRNAFTKIFGNHDLYWDNSPVATLSLEQIYGEKIPICEGLLLKTDGNGLPDIFMTHGHQGDLQSDGNWFSKWFVSNIWGPFQAYLRINPNTPANNDQLKTVHNRIMYEWSAAQQNLLLITGHTHQPVFRSFTHLELLYDALAKAKNTGDEKQVDDIEKQITVRHVKGDTLPVFTNYLDTYFNSGCCCFDDGDITGIEIQGDTIRLIKGEYQHHASVREILQESKLGDLKVSLES